MIYIKTILCGSIVCILSKIKQSLNKPSSFPKTPNFYKSMWQANFFEPTTVAANGLHFYVRSRQVMQLFVNKWKIVLFPITFAVVVSLKTT